MRFAPAGLGLPGDDVPVSNSMFINRLCALSRLHITCRTAFGNTVEYPSLTVRLADADAPMIVMITFQPSLSSSHALRFFPPFVVPPPFFAPPPLFAPPPFLVPPPLLAPLPLFVLRSPPFPSSLCSSAAGSVCKVAGSIWMLNFFLPSKVRAFW